MDFFTLLDSLDLHLNKELAANITTHPSASHHSYDRLEILGDAALRLLVVQRLYKENPTANSGILTKQGARIVNNKVLGFYGDHMNLDKIITVGENYERGIKDLADVVEAFFGGVYLHYGLIGTKKFLDAAWNDLHKIADEVFRHGDNPIGELQEIMQKVGFPLPTYEIVAKTGNEHLPTFNVKLTVDIAGEKLSVFSVGKNKKEANAMAAIDMLELLEENSLINT